MFSTKFVFILVAFSVFTVAKTSLLNGVLNILGLNALLPCQLIIDIAIFLLRTVVALGNLLKLINDIGLVLFSNLLQPLIVAFQEISLELAHGVITLPGPTADEDCLANLTDTLVEEVFRFEPNITIYVNEFIKAFDVRDTIREAQALERYIDEFSVCNRCDCVPKFIAILPEVVLKLGKIVAKNGLVGFGQALLASTNHVVTDFNEYFTNVTTGLNSSFSNYQICLANSLL